MIPRRSSKDFPNSSELSAHEWSRRGQHFHHVLDKFKEHARATCDAYTLVDADVTLHEAQERIVNSAGFSSRESYLEQYFRETKAFGADFDDVFV